MKPYNFRIVVETDKLTGKILAVNFQIRKGKSAVTREFANGNAFADYDSQGRLLSVELLAPCEIEVLLRNVKNEPQAKKFLRSSMPMEMALTG